MIDTNTSKASYGFKLNPSTIGGYGAHTVQGTILISKMSKRFIDKSVSYKIEPMSPSCNPRAVLNGV